MHPKRLSPEQVERELALRPLWTVTDIALRREFHFTDFRAAFAFMTAVARIAEEMNHHPDWSNSYGKVVVDLVSHDVGGLTMRDFALAAAIDALYGDPRTAPHA